MSNDNIDSILHEDRNFPPPASFVAKARIKSAEDLQTLRNRAADDHAGFWGEIARQEITWHKPFQSILDDSEAPQFKWFNDGQLNISVKHPFHKRT